MSIETCYEDVWSTALPGYGHPSPMTSGKPMSLVWCGFSWWPFEGITLWPGMIDYEAFAWRNDKIQCFFLIRTFEICNFHRKLSRCGFKWKGHQRPRSTKRCWHSMKVAVDHPVPWHSLITVESQLSGIGHILEKNLQVAVCCAELSTDVYGNPREGILYHFINVWLWLKLIKPQNWRTNLESETSRESATKNQKLKPANQKLNPRIRNQNPKNQKPKTARIRN